MTSSLSNLFAVAEEQTRELPMPPQAFGALAFVGFLALLGFLWAFRNTAQKVADTAHHGDHAGHQGGHH
jgi:hypothetical protein